MLLFERSHNCSAVAHSAKVDERFWKTLFSSKSKTFPIPFSPLCRCAFRATAGKLCKQQRALIFNSDASQRNALRLVLWRRDKAFLALTGLCLYVCVLKEDEPGGDVYLELHPRLDKTFGQHGQQAIEERMQHSFLHRPLNVGCVCVYRKRNGKTCSAWWWWCVRSR